MLSDMSLMETSLEENGGEKRHFESKGGVFSLFCIDTDARDLDSLWGAVTTLSCNFMTPRIPIS